MCWNWGVGVHRSLAEALASPGPGDAAAAAAVPAEVKRECRELFLGHCPPSVTVKHVYDHWSGLGNDVITNIKWSTPNSRDACVFDQGHTFIYP